MSQEFSDLLEALRALGEVSPVRPLDKQGKPSKFLASIRSRVGNSHVSLGLIDLSSWKRKIGVNKITQTYQYIRQTDLDGALILGSDFSQSAQDQAARINHIENKKIILLNRDSLDFEYD